LLYIDKSTSQALHVSQHFLLQVHEFNFFVLLMSFWPAVQSLHTIYFSISCSDCCHCNHTVPICV